jgi:starvation-inducible DNA-binding protein
MPRMASSVATRIDLPAEVRDDMIVLLNQQLADTFDLFSQTKQAHWNVKGPQFQALHELFDDLAAKLADHVDLIAERATALGGVALGTARMASAATRLADFPARAIDGALCVEELARRYAELAASTRHGIEIAARDGDLSTSDLLTEVSRALDKALWFLEAHIQA